MAEEKGSQKDVKSKDESDSQSEEKEKSVYTIDTKSRAPHVPKYHVKMTTGARKILTEEEAKMLINMISHEFSQRPQLNIFTFDKVGLVVIKNRDVLTILTKVEKDNLSKPT